MAETDKIIGELETRSTAGIGSLVTSDDIRRWSEGAPTSQFFDALALNIARAYQAGRLSYTVCDGVMNDLWWIVLESSSERRVRVPPVFCAVFEAFDAGEYHRKADKSDNPVAEFTNPALAEILRLHSDRDA